MEDEQFKNVTKCRYHGYFTNSDHKYLHSDAWWRVMLSKMVFVLVFEHLVFFILMIIQYAIPDVPDSVTLHVARNQHVNKSAAYKVLSLSFLSVSSVSSWAVDKTQQKPSLKQTLWAFDLMEFIEYEAFIEPRVD